MHAGNLWEKPISDEKLLVGNFTPCKLYSDPLYGKESLQNLGSSEVQQKRQDPRATIETSLYNSQLY